MGRKGGAKKFIPGYQRKTVSGSSRRGKGGDGRGLQERAGGFCPMPPRLPPPPAAAMDSAISWVADTLDYEPLRPAAAARAAALRRQEGTSPLVWYARALLKLACTTLAGLAIGATAAAMHGAIDALVGWRNAALQRFYAVGLLQAYAAQLAISCALALAAAGAVQAFAPRAAGGGVTWCMAFLNGNAVTGLFSPTVFAVKWAGSVAAMGAALCLGVEAPMVHLGACVAWAASKAERRCWSALARRRWLYHLVAGPHAPPLPADDEGLALALGGRQGNVEEREAVSAGAAAGIAAAFGAPIGGVLFALEEACSVWNRRIAWRCFVASAAAVFAHTQLNPRSLGGLLAAPLRPLHHWEWLRQLPLLALVSAGGGLLGAAFNRLRLAARPLRARAKDHAARLREVALVAAATTTAIAALAAAVGRCLPVPEAWARQEREWVQHACPVGQYNDLATAWLGPAVSSIRSLISLGTSQEPLGEAVAAHPLYYSPAALAAMCAAYLPLFAASAALAVPGGLFMPSLLMGGTFGALAGGALRTALPGWDIQPGLYALCSATAVLGSVFGSSISLAVLMTEATGTLAPLMGVIVAVLTANAVAVLAGTEGVYESELEHEARVNYLPQEPPRKLAVLLAGDVMSSPVEGLPRLVPVAAARQALRRSRHNGFPVYDPAFVDEQTRTFRLDGLILRSQVELLLAAPQVHCDAHGRPLYPQHAQRAEERIAAAMAARLGERPSGGTLGGTGAVAAAAAAAANGNSFDGGSGGPDLRAAGSGSSPVAPLAAHPSPFDNQAVEPYLNLGPYMSLAPASVRLATPAAHVHSLLLGLSLRHVCVVDERNHVQGMITRRDLAHAAGSVIPRSLSMQDVLSDLDSLLERPLLSGDV
ncbi:family transporter: chloride ion channel [Micractinium conductrix]|uniref:Chloride channel protein n=1 Tax=Micractinium conductrix TaxID=554055 RepID=A0A2P6VCF8_9CHLO|nr:family transporter: chloride ion channel [Micractinium conductrix]|eukprot:PSC71767.1 family transporter: chloride ion channel [Micractinium conductrix]